MSKRELGDDPVYPLVSGGDVDANPVSMVLTYSDPLEPYWEMKRLEGAIIRRSSPSNASCTN